MINRGRKEIENSGQDVDNPRGGLARSRRRRRVGFLVKPAGLRTVYRAVFEIRSLKVSGSIPVYDFTFRPDLSVEIYRRRATLDLHNFPRQIGLSEKKCWKANE